VLEQSQGVFVQILMAGLVYHRQIALLFPDGVSALEPVLDFLALLIGVGQPNGNDAGFFISGYFHAVSPFIQIVAGCGRRASWIIQKTNILGEYASLDNFINQWTGEEKKDKIRTLFRERGIDLEALKADQGMSDVDDFDFICHVAFDRKPLTRKERANNVKKRDFLSRYGADARAVLEALLQKYMNTGIYDLESLDVLKLDPLKQFGAPSKIVKLFGGKEGYLKAIRELEEELYNVG
jgi:hypothetical protein